MPQLRSQDDRGEQTGGGTGHRTTVVERGSFVTARCSCGWRGPARRARDRARRDAADHTPD
ncbi:hypothetical protein [Actinacidiphila epipremni]|uniref:Uncharacterized protein n=1 Tax=Actinacidiphila epipremni TaxID=2053013 RepID=A0ABX0ZVI3_9ACTN|nr:hypothetical protein [Actinacidiphila epipremni]NJP46995.1 hypothetical protein [Actinacidiphila epipremni]